MRKVAMAAVIAVVVAVVVGISVYAQTAPPAVAVSFEADSIERLIPVSDIGIVKPGPANLPLTFSGNVVIVANGMRLTADSAVWHPGTSTIVLNGGSVRADLASPAKSYSLRNRREAQ